MPRNEERAVFNTAFTKLVELTEACINLERENNDYIHMKLMKQSLRSAGWSWSAVREKHCYLASGWRL